MAIQQHLNLLKRSVETWHQSRKDNSAAQPDLSEAFEGAYDECYI